MNWSSRGEFETRRRVRTRGEGEFEGARSARSGKIYADAMMEHLGHLAAESESEQEAAEHFLPLIGLAARNCCPLWRGRPRRRCAKRFRDRPGRGAHEPRLTRGITTIAKRPLPAAGHPGLLRALPTIARRTVGSIAKQVARGRPLTARGAIRTLARQTAACSAIRVIATTCCAAPHARPAFSPAMGPRRCPASRSSRERRPGYGRRLRAARRVCGRRRPGGYGSPPAPGRLCAAPGADMRRAARVSHMSRLALTACRARLPAPAPAYCRCCGQIIR